MYKNLKIQYNVKRDSKQLIGINGISIFVFELENEFLEGGWRMANIKNGNILQKEQLSKEKEEHYT